MIANNLRLYIAFLMRFLLGILEKKSTVYINFFSPNLFIWKCFITAALEQLFLYRTHYFAYRIHRKLNYLFLYQFSTLIVFHEIIILCSRVLLKNCNCKSLASLLLIINMYFKSIDKEYIYPLKMLKTMNILVKNKISLQYISSIRDNNPIR